MVDSQVQRHRAVATGGVSGLEELGRLGGCGICLPVPSEAVAHHSGGVAGCTVVYGEVEADYRVAWGTVVVLHNGNEGRVSRGTVGAVVYPGEAVAGRLHVDAVCVAIGVDVVDVQHGYIVQRIPLGLCTRMMAHSETHVVDCNNQAVFRIKAADWRLVKNVTSCGHVARRGKHVFINNHPRTSAKNLTAVVIAVHREANGFGVVDFALVDELVFDSQFILGETCVGDIGKNQIGHVRCEHGCEAPVAGDGNNGVRRTAVHRVRLHPADEMIACVRGCRQ